MKEFEFTFDKGLRSGLRKNTTSPRDEQALIECHNFAPAEEGLGLHEAVNSLNVAYTWGGLGTPIALPVGVELLLNTSFENGTGPDDWVASNNANLDRHADPHTGTYCLEINCNGSNNPMAYQRLRCDVASAGAEEVPILGEKDYRLSVWVKQGTGTSFRIRVYDASNTTQLGYLDGTATGSWVQVTLDVTTLAGTDDVIVELYHLATAGAGTTVLFDDVSFRRIEE